MKLSSYQPNFHDNRSDTTQRKFIEEFTRLKVVLPARLRNEVRRE